MDIAFGPIISYYKVDIRRIPSLFWRTLNRLLAKWDRLHTWAYPRFIEARTVLVTPGAWHRNILTNAGIDWVAAQLGSAAAGTASFVGLSSDTGTPLGTDVTLTGELTTNGLGRAGATYSHTTAARNYSLGKTFTYTGSSSVTVNKVGIFSAIAAGTLIFEALVTAGTVNANGDLINFTGSITF